MRLFSGQDSKGKSSPVKSSDIEQKYQSNPSGSFTFTAGSDSLEIKFKGDSCSHNFQKMHIFMIKSTAGFFSVTNLTISLFVFY